MGGKAKKLMHFMWKGFFISSQVFSLAVWPTQLLTEQLQGEIMLGIKRLVRETDFSPPICCWD
jgi:hypothetical protein